MDSGKKCKCLLRGDMIPGLQIMEASMTSPSDLRLTFMAGDKRIPSNFGLQKCNNRIPIRIYGRTGKFNSRQR